MGYKKYDKATRRKIRARIKALHKEGHSYVAMSRLLHDEGFTSPAGKPLTSAMVTSQGIQAGLRKQGKNTARAAKARALEATEDGDDAALADLILDANISDAKKVALLRKLRSK